MSHSDTALIVGDLQHAILKMAQLTDTPGLDSYLQQWKSTIDKARKAGVLIVYTQVQFRSDYADISDNNKMMSLASRTKILAEGGEDAQIHPAVAPQDGDVRITKRRVGAFHGTDLEVVLRSRGIKKLVLGGLVTSGVILSTVRHAADADYTFTVLGDLCRDRDAELQRILLENAFPRQGDVETSESWTGKL